MLSIEAEKMIKKKKKVTPHQEPEDKLKAQEKCVSVRKAVFRRFVNST